MACAWYESRPERHRRFDHYYSRYDDDNDRQDVAQLRDLFKCLRYGEIDAHYWANVLPACPLLAKAGALPWAMRRAMCPYRDGAVTEFGKAEWEISTTFSLEEFRSEDFEEYGTICLHVGLVSGYPLLLTVKRIDIVDDDDASKIIERVLSLDFLLEMPELPVGEGEDDDDAFKLDDESASLHLFMDMRVRVSGEKKWRKKEAFFECGVGQEWFNYFEKHCEEVVKEDSPHFPDGEMKIEARFRLHDFHKKKRSEK